MRTKILLIAILLVLAISFLIWWLLPTRVQVVMPIHGPAVEAVYATGTVEPTVMFPVSPRISARIAEIKIDEGGFVKAGDVLAKLDDAESQANLNDLISQEALAKREFDRNSNLIERGAISQVEYDRARFGLRSATDAKKAAEARLSYLLLIAPSDGIVIRRDGEVGELIPINKPIYWLSGEEPLRISAEVDEEDIIQVKVGGKVLIRADALPGQELEGKVESVTPKGDAVARSFRVRISFSKESPLRIGMTAETNIIVKENLNALLVPNTSLLGNELWVLSNGTLHKNKVLVGAKGSEQTEIISGILEGEMVVVIPSPRFTEGMCARKKLKV